MSNAASPALRRISASTKERHYTGCRFNRHSTTAWAAITRSLALQPPVPMSLKNGVWFEVRVAAVNANGTRGFSHPSKPFRSPAGV
ncbi:unnamed protein product [Nesidiocoris tenuis]|uniref:Fibronectin type-III domain-containing protein n=1 Tax=Nesidiocoris tenuis TaxID=355587 RepID=A0A6H5G4K9_9HEMI|nr:unnamed protein product [Nesidiocoris tenuis]CAB0000433.1 unnamed protein product [Nesidiocoris tenuis]